MRIFTFLLLVLLSTLPSFADTPDWCYERKVQVAFVNGMVDNFYG